MHKQCILCRVRPPIKNSHVVPKFAVKRLKAGNPIGTLVHTNVPRQIFQDAWKGDFLCEECEKAFCVWEDWVCKKVYEPFLKNGKINIGYDEKFGLFAASLCFRFIQFIAERNPEKEMTPLLKAMFENLRENLFKKNFLGIRSYLYAQFLEPVTSLGQFPPGVNTYFFESIDGQCFDYFVPPSSLTWMVYVKLPACFFLLSGCDLKMIFYPPTAVDPHIIHSAGTFDSSLQSGMITRLLSDKIAKKSAEIQISYSKMSLERIKRNAAKITSLPNRQQFRAHNSHLLDQKLLADLKTAQKKYPPPKKNRKGLSG